MLLKITKAAGQGWAHAKDGIPIATDTSQLHRFARQRLGSPKRIYNYPYRPFTGFDSRRIDISAGYSDVNPPKEKSL